MFTRSITLEKSHYTESRVRCLDVGLARTVNICTVYLVISLPKVPYIHRIYMALANPVCMYIRCSKNLHDSCLRYAQQLLALRQQLLMCHSRTHGTPPHLPTHVSLPTHLAVLMVTYTHTSKHTHTKPLCSQTHSLGPPNRPFPSRQCRGWRLISCAAEGAYRGEGGEQSVWFGCFGRLVCFGRG
jgi:hypothetical protein